MKYFFEDKDIEEAMLKSCLLYNRKEIKDKRNNLFQKFLLSLVINGVANSRDTIKQYVDKHRKNFLINDSKIDSTIAEIEKNGLVSVVNGEIILTPETQTNIANDTERITAQLNSLVNDILNKVQTEYKKTINNIEQVRANIKECINYYYAVTGHSFFELDKRKEVKELPKLEVIASVGLKSDEKDELSNVIIYATGCIIDKPTPPQQDVLEVLARTYITTQIMDIDPLLGNFKSTIIKEKEFILDTDVVLYAITDNAPFSKQYKMMIKQLMSCGCKIFIPKEVIVEVYNHAEAARKRYPFVSKFMDNRAEWVSKEFKNIFIEDYYFTNEKFTSSSLTWGAYIGNFYNPRFGSNFTLEQIKEKLGDNIIYGDMPNGVTINDEDRWKLEAAALEETNKTEKAVYREENKNEDIAKTDTMLYLSVKYLNEINNVRMGIMKSKDRFDMLINKYYILTTSIRIHFCAKSLGLDSNVLCKPLSLMAYLAETGIMPKNQIKITSLFDNPFLLHTAKFVWNDVKALVNSGVDIKGKNIVTMRFDLQKEINDMLADKDVDEKMYESITGKGYAFEPMVEKVMEKSRMQDSTMEEMIKEMAEMKEEIKKRDELLEKANQTIESKDKIISRKRYEERKEKASKNHKNRKK